MKTLPKYFFISFLFTLAACQTTKITTGYYDLQGKTEKELNQSIKKLGPMNGHAFAAAEIKFNPLTFDVNATPFFCKMEKVKLQVIAKITLPRWPQQSGASASLKKGFKNMQTYAKWHEKQHVKIAEASAQAMEKGLLSIPAQQTCPLLKTKIKSYMKKSMALHEKIQKKFDSDEQKRLKALFKQS